MFFLIRCYFVMIFVMICDDDFERFLICNGVTCNDSSLVINCECDF